MATLKQIAEDIRNIQDRLNDLEITLENTLDSMPTNKHSRAFHEWNTAEKQSLVKAFHTFIDARSGYHRRSHDAILAFLEHNGLLRWNNINSKLGELNEQIKAQD